MIRRISPVAPASDPSKPLDPETTSRAYRAAYATALVGSLVSAGLTYVYLQNGAHELNPVVRTIIAVAGLEAMVLVKTAIIVGCYHGYVHLVPPMSTRVVLGFAWLGALINLGNALYDMSVAVRAGLPPVADVFAGAGLVLAAMGVGVALRPGVPSPPGSTPDRRHPTPD